MAAGLSILLSKGSTFKTLSKLLNQLLQGLILQILV